MSFIMRPIRFAPTGHIIEGSGLFNGSSGYLSRTPASAGNRKTFILDIICKRSKLGADERIFEAQVDGNNFIYGYWRSNNTLEFSQYTDPGYDFRYNTNQVFRDVASYMNLRFEVDTTAGTGERVKIFLNGTRITSFATATEPSVNFSTDWNTTNPHYIGYSSAGSGQYFTGYASRFVHLDGQTSGSMAEVTDDGFWQINSASDLTYSGNSFLLEGSASIAGATNQVPDMTSATEPSGTVTTSHETSGQEGFHAFDRNTSGANQWNGNNSGAASLTYQFPSAKQITAYSIQNRDGNTNGAADTWQFQGSNNGSDFTTIQTISSAQSFGAGELKTYFPNNDTSYTHYRINVLTSRVNEGPIISEWAMYENIDSSGNNSGWIQTGTITATSDSPTNDSANGYGNYATPNPLSTVGTLQATFTNGNLTVNTTPAGGHVAAFTIPLPTTGKWVYKAIFVSGAGNGAALGVYEVGNSTKSWDAGGQVVFNSQGKVYNNSGSPTTTGLTTFAAGDTLEIFADMDNGNIYNSVNGATLQGPQALANTSERHLFAIGSTTGSATHIWTVVQDFTPTDTSYSVLATQNLPTPAPINYQDEYYILANIGHTSGTTTDVHLPKTVSGGAMVRLKRTDSTGSWYLFDTVRGANKSINWNDAVVEDTSTFDDQTLSGTSFVIPSAMASGSYLLECFYMGSYFQIKAYTGTGSAHAETYSAALDTAPGFMITITRTTTSGPHVYHSALGATEYIRADSQAVAVDSASRWNDVEPTTTQFTVGTSDPTNANGVTIISYHWANSGPYAFGLYDSNLNADGPMINLSGSPATFGAKRNDGSWNWVQASQILGDNENYQYLENNNTTAMNTTASVNEVDFLSNGMKMRDAGNNNFNGTAGADHLYWAFGIQPLTDGAINQSRAGAVPPYDQAYGGNTIKRVGNFWVHTFTSSGTFTPHKAMDVEYIIIGGGGGGGFNIAGGGGAGGYRTATGSSVSAQDYAITVGAGGAGSGTNNTVGANGGGSVFNSITSLGGGGGGSGVNNVGTKNGVAGGSGGGGNGDNGGAGGSSSANGNNGGNGVGASSPNYGAGGGGGSGAVGANGTNTAGGAGGAGTSSSIDGTATVRAGGGGGGSMGGTAGVAGSGGAGAATNSNTTAAAATANTGSGGGGGGRTSGSSGATGGAGGSGVVIIKYAIG